MSPLTQSILQKKSITHKKILARSRKLSIKITSILLYSDSERFQTDMNYIYKVFGECIFQTFDNADEGQEMKGTVCEQTLVTLRAGA